MYKEGIHFMDYRTILQEENDAGSLTAIILDAFPALY